MSDAVREVLERCIRDVPDFPKPGILFKDITPVLSDPCTFNLCLDAMAEQYDGKTLDVIVGVEARGFIFGAALASRMRKAFVPARKPGKLPAAKRRVEYQLEYGTDAIEIHVDGIQAGQQVLVVDDVLATGGTAAATCELVRLLGGEVIGTTFVIELTFLNGRERLRPIAVSSLVQY
jgi:adenine phosphoribosyltransferase